MIVADDMIEYKTWIAENVDTKTFSLKVVVDDSEPFYKHGFKTRVEAEEYADRLPALFTEKVAECPHYQAEGGEE